MKKTSFQPSGNVLLLLALIAVFLVIIITISCKGKDPLIIDRTHTASGIDSSGQYSMATILPPKPDTHFVARSTFTNHDEMEVDYDATSQTVENSAHLMGPNDEILGTAKVESFGEPEMVSNKPVYHMRAVFQLDKAADKSMLKVSLPNSASVTDKSSETLVIKIK